MTDVKQLREQLRDVARNALAGQPSAERAEIVAAELSSVFAEELDRMQSAWCGPKGRWGAMTPAAQRRIASRAAEAQSAAKRKAKPDAKPQAKPEEDHEAKPEPTPKPGDGGN